jgi:hypothetical protein
MCRRRVVWCFSSMLGSIRDRWNDVDEDLMFSRHILSLKKQGEGVHDGSF